MTVCQFCGTSLMEGARFCYKCERKLEYPDEGEAGGTIADSVVSRSTVGQASVGSIHIGDDKKYCQACGTPVTEKNRSIRCFECGTFFCATCETDFRTERKRGEHPYCDKCFAREQERLRQERLRKEAEERKRLEEKKKREEQERIRLEEKKKREEQERIRLMKKKEKEALEKGEFVNSIGMKLKLIPAGEFVMGSGKEAHKVKITEPFYLGMHQVTQREWQAVMGGNPSHFKGDNLPVENVSWNDCQKFIAALKKCEGPRNYRLPTEAEWEYACRAGSTTRYCFGDDAGQLHRYAWFGVDWGTGSTHPVGTKAPNAWELYDMHGNVWEWCEDWYGDYPVGEVSDPGGSSAGSGRVGRGGSWRCDAERCTSASRDSRDPSLRDRFLGLRLARSL